MRAETAALESEGYQLLAGAHKTISALSKLHEADQLGQTKLLELGRAYVVTQRIDRIGEQMQIWGEAAGTELRIEADQLRERVWTMICSICGPNSQPLEKALPTLVTKAKQRQSALDQVAKLRASGNFAKAEATLLPVYDELHSMAVLYRPTDRSWPIGPYDVALNAVAGEMRQERTQQAKKTLTDTCAAKLPDLAGFQTRLATAASEIGRAGVADWNGKQLTGPELVDAALVERKKLEVAAVACLGLVWATPQDTKVISRDQLQNLETFGAGFPASLAAVVDADAVRVADGEAPDVYLAYVKALSAWQCPTRDSTPPQEVLKALGNLAAKSPQFAAEVTAYQQYTNKLLQARARSAEARALQARRAFDAKLTVDQESDIPNYLVPAELLKGKVLGDAPGQRLGLHLAVKRPWTMGADGMATTGEFAYSCSLQQALWAKELASLQSDLQADVAPPLSLEAAWAIASAERGDLLEVGGEIKNVEVDSLLARMVGCKVENWGALDAKRLTTHRRADGNKMFSFRSELKPKWLRGNYFFVQLP
jgi:hypothetical protein